MRYSIVLATLLASTILPAAAFAQSSTPNKTATSTEAHAPMVHTGDWRASKLIGLNIYNQQNEKLGDINEILLDRAGKVDGYVVGVGGFLGMGEHDVFVRVDQIKFVNEPMQAPRTATNTTTSGAATTTRSARAADEKWYPDHGILNANKDQLKAMQQFKYSDAK